MGVRELVRQMRTDPINAKRLTDYLQQACKLRSVSGRYHHQRRVLRPTGEGMAVMAELAWPGAAQDDSLAVLVGSASLFQLQTLLERFEATPALTAVSKEEFR